MLWDPICIKGKFRTRASRAKVGSPWSHAAEDLWGTLTVVL